MRFEEIKIQSGKAVTYFDFGKDLFNPCRSRWPENVIIDNKVKGKFSKASKKRFSEVIKNWLSVIDSVMFKDVSGKLKYSDFIVFVTLTLSSEQMHDDKFIRRNMLNSFLRSVKEKYGVINYLYCSEAQSNGNIHFHIVLDRKIHHTEIRNIWNNIQASYGYIDKFESKHKHRDPNSTDIHSFRKIKSVAAYLIKYFTKDEKRRKIEGHLWGCSDNLRKIQPYRSDISFEIAHVLNRLVILKNNFIYKSEFFTMFKQVSFKEIHDINPSFCREIVQFYYNQEYLLVNE